jgi:hypothetical protein
MVMISFIPYSSDKIFRGVVVILPILLYILHKWLLDYCLPGVPEPLSHVGFEVSIKLRAISRLV